MKTNNTKFFYIKLFFTTLLLFPFLSINASTYTLYIASTKYKSVSKDYIEEVNDLLKIENLIVRTHVKENYSLIVNQIKDIETAKKIQNKLKQESTYKDTYIKKDTKDLKYGVLYYTKSMPNNKTVIKEDEKEYILDVESSNEYITASTMYNIGNYKRAYQEFKKLIYKHNYNLNINYFLAQSAIKLGLYDEASIALERVLIQNPKFNKARYDYARLLTKLKLNKEAKKEFNILLKENITEEIRKDIEKYLKFLNTKRKSTSNSVSLIVGVGHNTNVNNGLSTMQYTLPGLGDISVTGEEPISDNFHNEIISLDFNKILKSNPAIKIKNSFLAYNKSYFNEKNENTSVLSYKPNLSYIYNQNIYGLDLNATRVLKKEDNDINVLSLSPFIANKNLKAAVEYQKLLYTHKENKSKNFEKYSFKFTYNILNKLKLHTNLSKITRIKKDRIDLDKVSKAIELNYNYEFNNKNMLYFGYNFERSNYRYYNSFFSNKREDYTHNLILNYMYKVTKEDMINLASSFNRNNSNQNAYEYEEFETKLNYIKKLTW
jgi:TolA-binding protein